MYQSDQSDRGVRDGKLSFFNSLFFNKRARFKLTFHFNVFNFTIVTRVYLNGDTIYLNIRIGLRLPLYPIVSFSRSKEV